MIGHSGEVDVGSSPSSDSSVHSELTSAVNVSVNDEADYAVLENGPPSPSCGDCWEWLQL